MWFGDQFRSAMWFGAQLGQQCGKLVRIGPIGLGPPPSKYAPPLAPLLIVHVIRQWTRLEGNQDTLSSQ